MGLGHFGVSRWGIYYFCQFLLITANQAEVFDTVEVRSSSLLVPTIFSIGIQRIPEIL